MRERETTTTRQLSAVLTNLGSAAILDNQSSPSRIIIMGVSTRVLQLPFAQQENLSLLHTTHWSSSSSSFSDGGAKQYGTTVTLGNAAPFDKDDPSVTSTSKTAYSKWQCQVKRDLYLTHVLLLQFDKHQMARALTFWAPLPLPSTRSPGPPLCNFRFSINSRAWFPPLFAWLILAAVLSY